MFQFSSSQTILKTCINFQRNTRNKFVFFSLHSEGKCFLLGKKKIDTYPLSLSAGMSRFSEPPTARMQDCGGLMMAEKFLTPNIPKLEMVNVPPWWWLLCGCVWGVEGGGD